MMCLIVIVDRIMCFQSLSFITKFPTYCEFTSHAPKGRLILLSSLFRLSEKKSGVAASKWCQHVGNLRSWSPASNEKPPTGMPPWAP